MFHFRCLFPFPHCQVRVVRFYQTALPPPRPPPPRLAVLFLLVLLLQFLFDYVCINCHLHFRLANSLRRLFAPSSLPTSQLSVHRWPSTSKTFLAQCAPLDLNLGPFQLSVRRWTSTWDLLCSVCAAGPQPGTCPAQCALLDLNLGPAQLSVHHNIQHFS